MDVYVYSCINKSVKKFEKVNQSNIFLYHVIEKMIFYKFIIFWRIPKSSKMNSDFPPTANAQLSSKASPLLRKSELLYIRDKISYNDIKYYFAFLYKVENQRCEE